MEGRKVSKVNDTELEKDILWKIHENLIRAEERLRALIEANSSEHKDIRADLLDAIKKTEEMEKRIKKLEDKAIAISTSWKIAFFLIGSIPTIILILDKIGLL